MIALDHLAVAGDTLDASVAHVEETLGVKMGARGQHARMGTHNRLLGLGAGLYLEAIAVDPEAPRPPHPRWFDLDHRRGPAGLANWILRTDDLAGALASVRLDLGRPLDFVRGDYRWQMAVPEDGKLPFDGAAPALIEWGGDMHPAAALDDSGCRLVRVEIAHPKAGELLRAMPALLTLKTVLIGPGPVKEMRADFLTPHGLRHLR
ncbi:MAG: VOC family protein [Rhodobacteraceae bacterium]|nr:VOC family protein [Alphaproteobacteria bacterium]NNK66545.1 VOC family protein [Paracoccaceae bacterium]